MLAALAGAALMAAAWPAHADFQDDTGPVSVARHATLPLDTHSGAAVRHALREAEARAKETVERWLAIAEVPSLSGHETERARMVAQLFREGGLPARVLPDGNVEAVMQGSSDRAAAVLSAHLDALNAPTADNPVRRDDELVLGPGVLDDASGLAAVVTAARLLAEAGYKPDRTVRFVATVGEEVGLVGAKSYLADNRDLAAFVSVDGVLGAVDYGATGIEWTKYRLTGRGGHTLVARRSPSPSFAAGRAIAAIADLAQQTDLPVNVGQVEGGTAPNAIPTEVSFVVDARGDDAAALARLCGDIRRVVRAAADREGVRLDEVHLQSLPAASQPGGADAPLVAGTVRILDWLGVPAVALPRGSSDHNAALIRGIPALAVGATSGKHAHAPTESADVPLLMRGVKQCILLTVLLGDNLPEASLAR